MQDLILTVGIGTVSGVITAAFLWLMKGLFVNMILPYYQKAVYQGAMLGGTWEGAQGEGGATLIFVLKQAAHKITGTLHIELAHADPPRATLPFEITGDYWEGYLSLICKSTDPTSYSKGTVLLKLVGGGNRFEGDISLRNLKDDKVTTISSIRVNRL